MSALLLAWIAGIAWQTQQAALLEPALAGVGLALAVVLLVAVTRWAPARWRPWLLVPLLAGLGYLQTDLRASLFTADALVPELEGRDIEVTGLVAAMPQMAPDGLRLRLAVEQARLDGQAVRLPPLIDLGWYGGVWSGLEQPLELLRAPGAVQAGERWRLTVRLKAPHGGRNPHGFDYELWLWEQGVQATGYVRATARDAAPQRLATTWHYPLQQARQRVRDAILARLAAGTAESAGEFSAAQRRAGVVAALVTGDQRAIERADWDVFRATGVAHLMSISGLHVTMFAWLASALVGWLWRRSARLCLALPAPSAAALGGLLLALAYALFSGWGVPAQRTVWMLATVTLLRLSGRQWPWPVVWLLACAVVLAVDPWAVLQPGFWLSFVAVGVLFASAREAPGAGWRQRLRALLHEQWVVTLALTPLSLLLFGQTSLVGLAANALAIPWVTLVVTPLSLLGVAWPPLWDVAGWTVQVLAGALGLLAAWPWASLTVAQAPLWAGVAGLLGGLLLVMRLPVSLRLLGLPLLLPVLLWQAPRPPEGEFTLLAPDVGQGNAVLVQTAHHALLYDAGPRYSRESDAGHRVLVPLLRALGVRLDRLVLSHRDSDHTGGARAVLAMQPEADVLSSIEPGDAPRLPRSPMRCEAGQRWEWDSVRFEVLHPEAEDYARPQRGNALSCVLRVSNGMRAVLLAGDIEQAQETRLLAAQAPLRADLLLVPHHGSKTSSSAAFIEAVAPAMALAQAGYRNRFGHPAPLVVQRYTEAGVPLQDSARCGALSWRSERPTEWHCEREQARRYWQHALP